MVVNNEAHLSYCTNIHTGETWQEIFGNLKQYVVSVKQNIVPNKPFGIGLRLSEISATELLQNNNLAEFKIWLSTNQLYVFTINGFPYGSFHDTVIKDKVHTPDWTTSDRLKYTKNLMDILSYILPENMEGSVSTSPLSYKYWFTKEEDKERAKQEACKALVEVVLKLIDIKKTTGKLVHLGLEPEPDGFLENTEEVVSFYTDYLFQNGVEILMAELKCTSIKAKEYIQEHLQLCYDVCHFALAYEKPEYVMNTLKKAGIKIGKIQISAAIKCEKSNSISVGEQQSCLRQFDEPTYLHQSVVKLNDGKLLHFSDLAEGIEQMAEDSFKEIRSHFHVPIFVSDFQVLESTQDDIVEALELWKKTPYCKHLEVETYTWAILPKYLQTDITSSITRELNWVINQLTL